MSIILHFVIEALRLNLLVEFEPLGHALFSGQFSSVYVPSPL